MTDNRLAPVRVRGLRHAYDGRAALDGVDLDVEPGEVHGLLGPNGAGKTTLLRALFGLLRPDAGTVHLFGRDLGAEGTRALAPVAGFVGTPRFYPYLTARENLDLLARLDGPGAADRIPEALATVDLADRADTRVRGWSTGSARPVVVVRSCPRPIRSWPLSSRRWWTPRPAETRCRCWCGRPNRPRTWPAR